VPLGAGHKKQAAILLLPPFFQNFMADNFTIKLQALIMKFLHIFRDENGATAIEYGLIAALIAVAAITAMTSLGGNLSNTFNKVNNQLKK
jgi:pilus assembly protein Flp/PilA